MVRKLTTENRGQDCRQKVGATWKQVRPKMWGQERHQWIPLNVCSRAGGSENRKDTMREVGNQERPEALERNV